MEKILLIINSRNPDLASIDFACGIASVSKTKLTGVFIENLYFGYEPVVDVDFPSYIQTVEARRNATITLDTNQAIKIFKDQCKRHDIVPAIYIDRGEPIQEIIIESRFSDLLIVEPDISFYNREEPSPSHFVREILANSECPVLIAVEKFEDIEEIVFCYDGSTSSAYAIKMFTSLFPEFSNKKAMLLEVNKSDKEEFTHAHRRMMEWLRSHYQSAYYQLLFGDTKEELFSYFFMKQNKLIVMGSNGKSMLFNFFKKSSSDLLLRTIDLPLFITQY